MINFDQRVKDLIIKGLSNSTGKVARIDLKRGGCLGTMLILNMGVLNEDDTVITTEGINFAVSKEARPYVDDIEIVLKSDLGNELIIKNNRAPKCNCGKSFKSE